MLQTQPTSPNMVALLCERARVCPERLALRFTSDGVSASATLTYGQLHEQTCRVAAALQALAKPGERALLLYTHPAEYVTAFLACLYAGVIAVPASPPASMQPAHWTRVAAIARSSRPRVLLTEESLRLPLTAARQMLPEAAAAEVFASDGETPPSAAWHMPAIASDDLAMLQYTSGSTGRPKGVMVSHANLMANERAICSAFSMSETDTVVSWLPLFHDMGLIGTLLQPLYSGVSAVLMAPQHFMERPERWLSAISTFGGTVSGAPDFAYRLCLSRVMPEVCERLDLRSWRLAFCGAEPVRADTLQAFAERFAPSGFDARALYPCYGLAEATLLVTGARRGAGMAAVHFDLEELNRGRARPVPSGHVLVSCGVAQPDHQVRIVDPESGKPLPRGQVGEVLVSGPSVTSGYFEDAEETAQSFSAVDGHRLLRTGDLGFEDEAGVFITGRRKDLIIIRGQNLYPQDVERTVEERVEVVRKGRTVAFAIEVGGREAIGIAAEVSATMQKLIEPPAVCDAIRTRVAEVHGDAPELVLLVRAGAIPVTSSGKLQRSECRRLWSRGKLDVFAAYGPPPAAG